MERNVYDQNQLREITLKVTNKLLLAETEPNYFGLDIQFCDTRFFERLWGIELFRHPLLSAYFSDEDFPHEPKLAGTIIDEYLARNYGQGIDHHLTLYESSSPFLFGTRQQVGEFGDHETAQGILVYRSPCEELTDNKVQQILDKSFSEGKNAIKPDEKRQLRLFVANIESQAFVYNQPLVLDILDKNIEDFLSRPLFGSELVNVALSHKYFVFIGRPERLGAYLEQKDRFDIADIQDLVSR